MEKIIYGRREFFKVAAGAVTAASLTAAPQVVKALPSAATELGKVKITNIKTAQIIARYVFNLDAAECTGPGGQT